TATVLQAAGRDTDALDLDGTSLMPLLADGVDVPAEALFWRFRTQRHAMAAARRGKWKYVRDGDAQFLFDLDADVGERSNEFSRRPEVAAGLREALAQWEQSLAGR